MVRCENGRKLSILSGKSGTPSNACARVGDQRHEVDRQTAESYGRIGEVSALPHARNQSVVGPGAVLLVARQLAAQGGVFQRCADNEGGHQDREWTKPHAEPRISAPPGSNSNSPEYMG